MSEKAKQWWKAAAVRAIKTVAQTAVATIGTAAVLSSVDWTMVASASVLAPSSSAVSRASAGREPAGMSTWTVTPEPSTVCSTVRAG